MLPESPSRNSSAGSGFLSCQSHNQDELAKNRTIVSVSLSPTNTVRISVPSKRKRDVLIEVHEEEVNEERSNHKRMLLSQTIKGSATDHALEKNIEQIEKEQNTSIRQDASSSSVNQPFDTSTSRNEKETPGKDGRTTSMIPKNQINGLNTPSISSARLEKPFLVKLHKIAFSRAGFIGEEFYPTAELRLSGSITIRWKEVGVSGKEQSVVINLSDCKTLHVNVGLISTSLEADRFLSLELLNDSPTCKHVKNYIASVSRLKEERIGNYIFIDVFQPNSHEKHKWFEFRTELKKLKIKQLYILGDVFVNHIKTLLKELISLTGTIKKQKSCKTKKKQIPCTEGNKQIPCTEENKRFPFTEKSFSTVTMNEQIPCTEVSQEFIKVKLEE